MPKQSSSSQLRRLMEGTLFVAVWMVAGFVLKLDATTYLLVGIPITIVFQKFIAKQPLRALWVRIAPSLQFNTLKRGALAIAAVFAFLNLLLLTLFISMGNWEASLYELVAILGSIPLAYSLSSFSKATFRPLIMFFATAGAVGAGTFILRYWLNAYYYHSQTPVTVESFLIVAVVSLIEYVPVVFLLEEVWFRGAFDSHIYHIGERRSDLTSLYVSLIWGAWHFPITFLPSDGLLGGLELLGQLLVFQGVIGFFLSIYWRKSGNLLVPGSVHAFIDTVRNALNG
jgi:membrane protease YdiL (CAAX protease family)